MIHIFKSNGRLIRSLDAWDTTQAPMYSWIFDVKGQWYQRVAHGTRKLDPIEAEQRVPKKVYDQGQVFTLLGATR
jgi:hypothetical protein